MPRRKREADCPAENVYSSSTGVRRISIGSAWLIAVPLLRRMTRPQDSWSVAPHSLRRHEGLDVGDRAGGRLGPARAHAHAGLHGALAARVDDVQQRGG